MGHPLRWNRTDLVYEVTIETIQGRYLLRPSREVRDLILGVISRAQAHYEAIQLFAFAFSRNRATFLLATAKEEQFAYFMAYVAGEISRKLGRLLDWSGKLWAGRYRAVPILDEEAITQRLRHVLSETVAEGLVASPRDWPGASCVPGLLGTMTIEGAWVDRDREARLRAAGLEPPASAYVRPYRVVLSPVPPWASLPSDQLVARHRELIESIEFEHLVATQGKVMDPLELQQQDPFQRPEQPARRGRLGRLCHSTMEVLASGFRTAYRQFCAAFRAAADAVLGGAAASSVVAAFPPGSNPRPRLPPPPGHPPSLVEMPAPAVEDAPEATTANDPADDTLMGLATRRWRRTADARAAGARDVRPPDAPPSEEVAQAVAARCERVTRVIGSARPPPRPG